MVKTIRFSCAIYKVVSNECTRTPRTLRQSKTNGKKIYF